MNVNSTLFGSGMGGLALASIMAKLRNWRVLERQFKIGGFKIGLTGFAETCDADARHVYTTCQSHSTSHAI